MSRDRHRHRTGLLGWLWRLFVLLVIWLLGVTAWIVWVGERDQAAKADAIIVLGAAAYDAKPSPVFEERIRHGLDLYEARFAPLLIFTGGYGGTGARFSESQVARRYALKHGVPDDAILIETASRNTVQNLVEAKRLMDQRNLHRVIIVSDPLHMARALREQGAGHRCTGLVHAQHALPQLPPAGASWCRKSTSSTATWCGRR